MKYISNIAKDICICKFADLVSNMLCVCYIALIYFLKRIALYSYIASRYRKWK